VKLAYTAGPYRDSREWQVVQNIREAEAIALELWKMGHAVICPRCDLIVMLPQWKTSPGAIVEHDFAIQCEIPVYLWPQDKEALEGEVKG